MAPGGISSTRLGHLSPPAQQRILRLAVDYGVSLEAPAWRDLSITSRGLIVLDERLAAVQAMEAQRRQHW